METAVRQAASRRNKERHQSKQERLRSRRGRKLAVERCRWESGRRVSSWGALKKKHVCSILLCGMCKMPLRLFDEVVEEVLIGLQGEEKVLLLQETIHWMRLDGRVHMNTVVVAKKGVDMLHLDSKEIEGLGSQERWRKALDGILYQTCYVRLVPLLRHTLFG